MTVYAGSRKFNTVQDLMASATLSKRDRQITGLNQIVWWKNIPVQFDSENSSSSFVEVKGFEVTVGWPAFYKTFRFDKISDALQWAEQVNAQWQQADQNNWREFVQSVTV